MLTFWRYTVKNDSNNSRKYKVDPKRRQAAKTAKRNLKERISELGYDPDVWTLEELTDWGSELDDDTWSGIRDDEKVSSLIDLAKFRFSKDKTFHSPPVKRGLYAFPPKLTEMFLVMWKDGSDKLRKTEFTYRKPSLWCHFEEEAVSIGVPILQVSGSWVRIPSSDYKRVLKKAISVDIKSHYKDFGERGGSYSGHVGPHNLNKHISLDRYEVFLII